MTHHARPVKPLPLDESAVSPVLATILMVAITVVLAATVFVIANGLGSSTAASATVVFNVNDAQDRAVVKASNGKVQWESTEFRLSADGGWAVNGNAATGMAAGEWNRAAGGKVYAGEYVDFCADVPHNDLVVEVRYADPSLGLTQLTFTNVGVC